MCKNLTRSRDKAEVPIFEDFTDLGMSPQDESEICSYSNVEIELVRSSRKFLNGSVFRVCGTKIKFNFLSPTWICFYDFPFSIELSFLFPSLISRFYEVTRFAYAQIMLVFWRILYWLVHLNEFEGLNLGLLKIENTYDLRTFGFLMCIFKIKSLKII